MLRVRDFLPLVILISFSLCRPGYSYSGGGIDTDPYQISWAEDWQILMGDPNNWDKHFVLTADIDLGGIALSPVGNSTTGFSGHLKGNGHCIENATINTPDEDYLGLFGHVVWNGSIQYLGLINIHMTGRSNVGGLVGSIDSGGTILNCYATGTVSGTSCVGGLVGSSGTSSIISSHANVSVNGYSEVGGLVGSIGSDFYSYIVHCYTTGSVSGFADVGGLIGMTWYGTVLDSYATGPVTGPQAGSHTLGGLIGEGAYSTIRHCYAVGSVGGSIDSYDLGSLIGCNYSTIHECFWNSDTSGQSDGVGFGSEDGIYGRTTGQMKQRATFIDYGWDFTGEEVNGIADIWRMCMDDVDYPKHNWQWSLQGDMTCPDGVALEDLAYLARHWLEYTNYSLDGADITGDKVSNLLDFEVLAAYW